MHRLIAVEENSVLKIYDKESIRLGSIKSIYRNLRENYEYRLRYDEAGKFFIKEMELKRNYREVRTRTSYEIVKNDWVRRNLSLTGLYNLFSKYGESWVRPVVLSTLTLVAATMYRLINTFDFQLSFNTETLWFMKDIFEKTLIDFLPFIPNSDQTKPPDYFIKSIGVLSFGLLLIALRRRFERKFRH
jgi:hypothetical protein